MHAGRPHDGVAVMKNKRTKVDYSEHAKKLSYQLATADQDAMEGVVQSSDHSHTDVLICEGLSNMKNQPLSEGLGGVKRIFGEQPAFVTEAAQTTMDDPSVGANIFGEILEIS